MSLYIRGVFLLFCFVFFLPSWYALWWVKTQNNDVLRSGTVPPWAGWVEVLNFDIIAWPRDVEIYSLYLKRRGLSNEDTITGVSAFSNGIKITDTEDENNGNDDEVELDIADRFIVPSGEMRTISIVANVASTDDVSDVSNSEFTFDLLLIDTPEWAQRVNGITGTTFRVGGVDVGRPEFIPDDPFGRISLSRNNRIFEFDIEAPRDSDITLEAIRLRSTYDDLDSDFENIVLAIDNKLISRGIRNDEYITFLLREPLFLQEWKRETFTIAARVKSRVDEDLEFFLDGTEDLIYIDENQGTRSGFYQTIESPSKTQDTPALQNDSGIKTDEWFAIEQKTLQLINAYIARVDQKYEKVEDRRKFLSDTIIALQKVATQKLKHRDTISGMVFLLRKRIEFY